MTERDKKQKELFNIILNHVKNNLSIHHSFIAGTGFGKSKVIIDLLKPLQELLQFKKVLILVDNTHLRDNNWKEDFEKWRMKVYYNHHVEMNTYQTAYKWTKNLDDYLIIYDEADFALTPEYKAVFETYQNVNSIAMTGYANNVKKNNA